MNTIIKKTNNQKPANAQLHHLWNQGQTSDTIKPYTVRDSKPQLIIQMNQQEQLELCHDSIYRW